MSDQRLVLHVSRKMAKFIIILGNESVFLPSLRAKKEREIEH